MKQHFSLNRLLHNDKLMMAFSVIVAIAIWFSVVYSAGNNAEKEITGVPISITLNDYASETLKLRVVDGAEATATVRVSGARSVIDSLSPQDITVTADTGNVIKEGTYVLQLRAVPNSGKDFSVINVVGQDGTTGTTTITCDVWSEQSVPVVVEMPNLKVSDTKLYQFGTPSISGDAVSNNTVMVSGPRMDINRIRRLVAKIADELVLSETTVLTAELIAYDEHDLPITTVSVVGAEDAKLNVTVPVMVYYKLDLTPTLLNVPAGYSNNQNLVTITPKAIELWSVPSELEEYTHSILQQLTIDFNLLDKEGLSREIMLNSTQGVRLVNGNETVKVKVNVSNVITRTVDIPLSAENIRVENCPEGMSVSLVQQRLSGIRICGPSNVVNRIRVSDIQLVVDMTGKNTAGQQVLKAYLQLPADTAWICYEDATGVDVQVEITEE